MTLRRATGGVTFLWVVMCTAASVAIAQQEAGQTIPLVVAPSTDTERWTGDLDGMLRRRYIRVAVAYSKTQYYVVRGVQSGVSYEMLKAFEQYVNRKFPPKAKGLRFHVIFRPTSRGNLFPQLVSGGADLAVAGLTVTASRKEVVDFSIPSLRGVNEVVVTGPDGPALTTMDDLAGREVFLRRSSSYWEHAERLNEQFKNEGRPAVQLVALPEDLEDEDILEMVNAGLLSTTIVDAYVAALWSRVFANLKTYSAIAINRDGQFAWALPKNTPKLMALVNEFLKTHGQGTTFGNIVTGKYMRSGKILHDATSTADLKKFRETAKLFRLYSGRYGMDYLLMMAQAYQESGLNHEAKSRAGAIGIMQLMPATGAQMNVGDIRQEEANIHAGVKYIRFMVDQYFAKEPMSDVNKMLFAFAAYNCGPNRVRQLRKIAAAQGLNPNEWIDSVEMVAAARVGAEPVTYVANIYKYYVAYKLALQGETERRKARESIRPKPS